MTAEAGPSGPPDVFFLETETVPSRSTVHLLRSLLVGGAIGMLVSFGQQKMEGQVELPALPEELQPPPTAPPPETIEFNGNLVLVTPAS